MDLSQINWSNDVRYVEINKIFIPTAGGVYQVLRNDGKPGLYTNVYVGKAEDLNKRYSDHLSMYEPNSCLKKNLSTSECYFRYCLIPGERDRVFLEKELLRQRTYECNVQVQ